MLKLSWPDQAVSANVEQVWQAHMVWTIVVLQDWNATKWIIQKEGKNRRHTIPICSVPYPTTVAPYCLEHNSHSIDLEYQISHMHIPCLQTLNHCELWLLWWGYLLHSLFLRYLFSSRDCWNVSLSLRRSDFYLDYLHLLSWWVAVCTLIVLHIFPIVYCCSCLIHLCHNYIFEIVCGSLLEFYKIAEFLHSKLICT